MAASVVFDALALLAPTIAVGGFLFWRHHRAQPEDFAPAEVRYEPAAAAARPEPRVAEAVEAPRPVAIAPAPVEPAEAVEPPAASQAVDDQDAAPYAAPPAAPEAPAKPILRASRD